MQRATVRPALTKELEIIAVQAKQVEFINAKNLEIISVQAKLKVEIINTKDLENCCAGQVPPLSCPI